ncbi:RNA polymerase sigma factor [Microbacterium sp.]|uniref:RNA polymerase sigma factor n=1 Tax=Microbacterium sp. TaxID=51671 RepID=UPI0039E59F4C
MARTDEPSTVGETLREIVADDRARLVGALTRWCGDLQLAEDGFSEAVEAALRTWPDAPPNDPRAWIVTVARNRIRDVSRSAASRTSAKLTDELGDALEADLAARGDDTLALLFACAHPALDRSVHAPLILQVALGVPTSDIATAFAMPVATLSKRLVRAKQKLRANRASFEIPEQLQSDRVQAVLDAIYAAYSVDWLRISPPGAAEIIAEEAIHASQLLLRERPEDHEIRGLAALLLLLHSRAAARIAGDVLVPIEEQDAGDWDHRLVARANGILHGGLRHPRSRDPGPYELQAAIQSAHATRTSATGTPWPLIASLYDALVAQTPSMGAQVARAVAIARASDAATGLAILDALAQQQPATETFQAFHAARGALLRDTGQTEAAVRALQRAYDLCTDLPSRNHLRRVLDDLST